MMEILKSDWCCRKKRDKRIDEEMNTITSQVNIRDNISLPYATLSFEIVDLFLNINSEPQLNCID